MHKAMLMQPFHQKGAGDFTISDTWANSPKLTTMAQKVLPRWCTVSKNRTPFRITTRQQQTHKCFAVRVRAVTATYFYGKGKVDADMKRGQDAWFTFSSVVCLPDVIFGDIAKALRISFYAAQLRYREVQQAFTLELNRFICCLIGVVFKIGRDLLNYTQNTSISGVKSSWYTLYKYISFIHPPLTWVQLSIENFMGIWKLVS